MGQCDIWCVSVYWLFSSTQIPRCPHHLYQIYAAWHQLDMDTIEGYASRRKCKCCKLLVTSRRNIYWLSPFNDLVYSLMVLVCFMVFYGGQFYWWRKPEYPEKTTDLSHVAHKLYHIRHIPVKTVLTVGNVRQNIIFCLSS